MNVRSIEESVISAAGSRWTKVAMVIARVSREIGRDGDEDYEMISNHIQTLVEIGRLEARGDTTNWRHSEVRPAEAGGE